MTVSVSQGVPHLSPYGSCWDRVQPPATQELNKWKRMGGCMENSNNSAYVVAFPKLINYTQQNELWNLPICKMPEIIVSEPVDKKYSKL